MKKTGLNGYAYDFTVDYDAITVDDILDIYKYLMKKKYDIKVFGFIKKVFFTGLTILSSVNPLSTTPLKCISMNNQGCKVRSEIVNVDSDEPVFYPFSVKTSKCSGSCNNNNDPYAKRCFSDVIKIKC